MMRPEESRHKGFEGGSRHSGDHPSDEELLTTLDGEVPAKSARQIQAHLAACWACRARVHEMNTAVAGFVGLQQEQLDPDLPDSAGPRALLRAQMSALAEKPENWRTLFCSLAAWRNWQKPNWAAVTAVFMLAAAGIAGGYSWRAHEAALREPKSVSSRSDMANFNTVAFAEPNINLTPGATVLIGRRQICAAQSEKNRAVSVPVQRMVFAEYGIPSASPQAYEVDYLITPALGGADDIHNLWPQPYFAPVWSASVKDQLEDHLRDLVCQGKLDLGTAQRDISTDWIAAYKKYFHTDKPLVATQQ